MSLRKEFQLLQQSQLLRGTYAESAREALAILSIPPEDINIQTSDGHKIVFTYEGETYVLKDVGFR